MQAIRSTATSTTSFYIFSIESDELVVRYSDGKGFKYSINESGFHNPEIQRIQKTLFHEKQIIIENCLFGVDINPKSVLICRLRLWIELLKSAYYTEESNFTSMETLPNIDINIKCGDSLISRFPLDKESGITIKETYFIKQYKNDVQEYKRATDKQKKAKLKVQIENYKLQMKSLMIDKSVKKYTLMRLINEYKEKFETERVLDVELTKTQKQALEKEKKKLNEQIEQLEKEINKLEKDSLKKNAFEWRFEFPEVLDDEANFIGFDVVIGNPPYISTKEIDDITKKIFQEQYGFADDTYNHFFFKGMDLLKNSGLLTYISSKTFWTIQTKRNLRNLLLDNTILILFDTANPFEAPMVDTCVAMIQKQKPLVNHIVNVLDGKKNLISPLNFSIEQKVYNNAPNKVLFIPNDYNKKIYERLGKKVNESLNQWWTRISTSKNIEKFKRDLEEYRNNLKPSDVTLLGLITEGGQGLATGNNGKFVGVLENTKWVDNVLKQRPEKLLLADKFCNKEGIRTKQDAQDFLSKLDEKEIRDLFDNLKEIYGRDIFGQGWLFRIVSKDEIADVNLLTEDEKLNGIKGNKTFVPYDKGDKDGNRWYAPTPYYIDWSRENVKVLQTDPKARWQGYQFYFREGFCWTDVNSTYLKSRLKDNGVYDVLTMSLFTTSWIPDWYFVCLINSKFISEYVDDFINSTSHFQINDARQLPVIIPTLEQLNSFEKIFNNAYKTQKEKFENKISYTEAEAQLSEIQKELDALVEEMYMGIK